MSGDVQPRKRRDKKKKKDDADETSNYARAPIITPLENEEVAIHVQKDDGTGGGICAKLVFFILLSALAFLIGLIFTEQQGLTNYSIEEESRFTQYFEGWISTAKDDHDDHDDLIVDHDDDLHNDRSDEEEADNEGQEDLSHLVDDDHDDKEDISKHGDSEEVDEIDEEEQSEEESEEVPKSEENDQDDIEGSEEQADEGANDDGDKLQREESEENIAPAEDNKSDEDDDQAQVSLDHKELEEDVEEENREEPIGVVKVAVGMTILVVAYVVLVKKRKFEGGLDDDDDDPEKKDLLRRNTIVVPPKIKVVEQVVKEQLDEVEEIHFHPETKKVYQTLRHTYERSLTPENDDEDIESDEADADQGDYEEEDGEEYDYEGEEDYELEEEEEEEDVEDEEEVPSDDDEELMKKLEAKYGKLSGTVEQTSQADEDYDDEELEEENDEDDDWKHTQPSGGAQVFEEDEEWTRSSAASYPLENITNAEDFLIFDRLDEAQNNIDNNAALALTQFTQILKQYPTSPRALYGKAKALDSLAELKQSNELLNQAIAHYNEVIRSPSVPDALMMTSADRCINRLRFMGHYGRAIIIHEKLIKHFPQDVKHRNQLAVTYLTMNKIKEARILLQQTLQRWPRDGFALVHYGFILKVNDNNLRDAVEFLNAGIATKEEGVIDGRFFFHLGDAFTRLERYAEAEQVHRDGVSHKVFLSVFQRSLYNVPRLTGRSWWAKEQLPLKYQNFIMVLETNFKKIRNEGIHAMNQQGFFQDEAENLRESGDWKQFELFGRGIKHKKNCQRAPFTCSLVQSFPDATGCRRGQIKFSVMHPGTHVWPHCGPTNCRLRIHVGLKVPARTFIRVANETRTWTEGSAMIFDDSFEHEVWHNGSDFRLVLIVDVWHPELSNEEKRSLYAI